PISTATRSAPFALRSATTTLAPSSAKRLAMPSPKPDAAPVMMATLSLRRVPFSLIEDHPAAGISSLAFAAIPLYAAPAKAPRNHHLPTSLRVASVSRAHMDPIDIQRLIL